MQLRERYRGALLGLATGDAIGTTVEFRARDTFPPVNDMVGGGPFNLEPGQWTDDTSMALCLATSLLECSGFDARDQMERYVNWMQNGYLSSTGICFDIGNATSAALQRFLRTAEPYSGNTDPRSAGNGPIMRLVPVPMYYYPDQTAATEHAALSSRTTHAATECVDACRLYARLLCRAFEGHDKDAILFAAADTPDDPPFAPRVAAIAAGEYRTKSRDEISGSGYVVDSLEAALWCFYQTDTYRDAILLAVNLGDDADTTAAVCGQIAGAYYGVDGIPLTWLDKLTMRDEIEQLADQLLGAHG